MLVWNSHFDVELGGKSIEVGESRRKRNYWFVFIRSISQKLHRKLPQKLSRKLSQKLFRELFRKLFRELSRKLSQEMYSKNITWNLLRDAITSIFFNAALTERVFNKVSDEGIRKKNHGLGELFRLDSIGYTEYYLYST